MKRTHRLFRYFGGVVAILLASAMLVGSAQAQSATGTIRVALTGADSASCGSPSQPCRTPQFAMQQLFRSSSIGRIAVGEILIAAGTYTPPDPSVEGVMGIGQGGNLSIRGGYSTSNWNISDPVANPTIFDGQNTKRGILITVPDAVASSCTVTITGLSIVNGRATATDPYGGGILIDNCANVRVANVTISNSKAIGQDNTNASGTSPGAGGGIAVRGNSSVKAGLTLSKVTLQNNQASGGNEASGSRGGLGTGGGLYAINSNVTATDLTVTSNSAKGGDAPGRPGSIGSQRADGLGGGIALIQSPSFTFNGLTVKQNTATGGTAGSLAGLGLGGAMFIELSTGTITNADISGNTAQGGASVPGSGTGGSALGGAIFSTDNALTLTSAKIMNNTGTGGTGATSGDAGGGGIYLTTGLSTSNQMVGTNLVIAANTLTGGSGGIVFGGGIDCAASQMSLDHSTLSGNSVNGSGAKNGWAIALVGFNASTPCNATLRNNIITDHASNPIHVNSAAGASTVTRTLINNNGAALIDNASSQPVTESGTFSGNPLFVSPGSPNYNYHIGLGSAAIDAATGSTTTTDFENQPRPIGAAADVGADEFEVGIPSSSTGDTTISLSWTPPPGVTITKYRIVYTKATGAGDASQGASPVDAGTSTNFTLTGLTTRKQYTVKVVAYNVDTPVAESTTLTLLTGRFITNLPFIVN